MGIYQLAIKNMRRNKLRNISAILRIGGGVFILLILVSSGLGISNFLQDNSSLNGNIFSNNSQSNSGNFTAIVSSITSYVESAFGVNLSNSNFFSVINKYLSGLVYLLDGIASIVFFLGVLDVLNAMNLNLSERKKEIGILKSLGYTKNQIMLSLSFEASIFGVFGSLLGVTLGSITIIFLSGLLKLPTGILLPLQLILGIILITTILCFILGLLPAWFASRLDLGETLKYE